MANYPVLAVGQRITADLLAGMQKNTVIKLATTSRAATVVLADDPELTISGVAGTYRIELDIIATGIAGALLGDLNLSWTVTGTSTAGYRCTNGPADPAQDASTSTAAAPTATRFRATLLSAAALTLGYPTAVTPIDIREFSPIATFSTSWTITIQWCQNTSNATATNVLSGSSLSAIRLA